ncbi:SDR family oxidoreductase [Ramlibacter sp. AW1]|uniref:SDR family oxidoreductase n=1 Tax=Ramlibacter aurantiacus TaxID=2801330 RepID=A0A936ZRB0_9BURK|nr:SDR family oxidoreductase [Ramlibacter aurantiacus]MBL0422185.1 SDR family oxidoreductase [Ramlibacter aurantiacus]
MKIQPGMVVVVTGASAGVGRAIATAFGRKGARVALLARDTDRLEEARREIEGLGGQALPIPLDMADPEQVEAAAERVEQELGPIDVWINNAMVTVVAPMVEITPQEFRRATDVTYHGVVWGTMAALRRMRARDRGSIVQIGSALAYRAIPLQAPYCGAKHAVNGFTEALRCELLHDKSRIHLGMVELPAVNTPQFDWCRTRMPRHPRPMGTVYQPEVIAKAVLATVERRRREVFVAFSSTKAIWADKLFPGLLDRYLARTAYEGQQMDEPISPDRPDNLFQPVPGAWGAHGRFDGEARSSSASLWLSLNKGWLLGAAGALALGWIAAQRGPRRL